MKDLCGIEIYRTTYNNTKVPPYLRICIRRNFNYGVRAYQTIIVGRTTCGILFSETCSTFVSRPVRAPKAMSRARTWRECRGSFERARAFHVIFIEWVDTHYFALQGPYERYVRAGCADRAERSRINDAREISRAYVQFCANRDARQSHTHSVSRAFFFIFKKYLTRFGRFLTIYVKYSLIVN